MAEVKPKNIAISFGDIEKKRAHYTVREAAELTLSYVDTTHYLDLKEYEYAGLLFERVQGGLTSVEYIIWQSHNGSTWFARAAESVAATVITDTTPYHTVDFSQELNFSKIVELVSRYIKLSVKGTGVVANSLLTVHITGVR